MKRWRRLWPLALALPVLLFFHRLAFTNLILARGDTFLYFYPYWEAAASAVRDFHIPLWNPSLFMGAPFVANSQIGFFYPLNWPLWYLLQTPYAVTASIVLHLVLAAWGAYAAARRAAKLAPAAAALAALLFALGGYLSAQVEHVNQLQGLAWLPWLLWAASGERPRLRRVLLYSLFFSLQLRAGHTQTVFISGVAVALWLLAASLPARLEGARDVAPQKALAVAVRRYALLLLGSGLALLLAAVQVIPTLELMQRSGREGGLPLNEALSFSLHPLLVGQSLLPGYEQTLFTEYVAYTPLLALALALLAAWRLRGRPFVWPPLLLVAAGLFMALGQFNPLYVLLAQLPGWSFFRAPARWLALFALGTSFLAGAGWQHWIDQLRAKPALRPRRTLVVLLPLLLLLVWRLVSVPLARILPLGPETTAEWPAPWIVGAWLLELALAALLLFWLPGRFRPADARRKAIWALPHVLILLVLFLATRSLPYNQPTTPEAFFALRPPVARLQALVDCEFLPETCTVPPGRLLSLSNIFFDLGDQVETDSAYADFLSADARYLYLIAEKHKEVISPNLPLAYGLTTVDGFDGGILPLRDYSKVVGLILPEGVESSDGRLREYLPAVPDTRYLNLFNARYLITDKAGDVWREGVFFDMQHPQDLAPSDRVSVAYVPDYEATELWLLAPEGDFSVEVATAAGNEWVLAPQPLAEGLWQAPLPEPAALSSIAVRGGVAGPQTLQALALVDARDGSFQQLVAGSYRLLHSGDVKLYQNLDVLPRAFLVYDWQWHPDSSAAVATMGRPDFDPRAAAHLVGAGEPAAGGGEGTGRAEISAYEAEHVTVRVETETEALLLLTDAYYPGWHARLDSEPVEIVQANGLFRGVFVPPGQHDVTFTYAPDSYRLGLILTFASAAVATALFIYSWIEPGRAALAHWRQSRTPPNTIATG